MRIDAINRVPTSANIKEKTNMSIQLKQLDYVIVYVSNMQRSLAFYRDTLGLTLKFTSPGWTEFVTGTTTIALHVVGSQGEEVTARQSLPGRNFLALTPDDMQRDSGCESGR